MKLKACVSVSLLIISLAGSSPAAVGHDDSMPIVLDFVSTVPTDSFLALHQNIPNPMTGGSTTLRFDLPRHANNVLLEIYNIRGALVRKIYSGNLPEGSFVQIWDGRDSTNKKVPSGLYFTKLQVDDKIIVNKMVITR